MSNHKHPIEVVDTGCQACMDEIAAGEGQTIRTTDNIYLRRIAELERELSAANARAERAEHDIHAYRGSLGYPVPGDHDGKLSDGTVPNNGIVEAVAAGLRADFDKCQADWNERYGRMMETEEQLRADALRYRWLRDKSVPPHNFYLSVPIEFKDESYAPHQVDAAIDAAIDAARGETP